MTYSVSVHMVTPHANRTRTDGSVSAGFTEAEYTRYATSGRNRIGGTAGCTALSTSKTLFSCKRPACEVLCVRTVNTYRSRIMATGPAQVNRFQLRLCTDQSVCVTRLSNVSQKKAGALSNDSNVTDCSEIADWSSD